MNDVSHSISVYNESSLHAGLKRYLLMPGDEIEAKVGQYIIDIKRNNLLIEIQTGHLYKMRKKIDLLSENYSFIIIYPVIRHKYIVHIDDENNVLRRRRSSKTGRWVEVLKELNNYPQLLLSKNLTLHLLLIDAEEFRINDGKGSWRRKGVSIIDRNLLNIVETMELTRPEDARLLIPEMDVNPFTNRELAKKCGVSLYNARWYTGALRKMGLISCDRKRGRENEYEWR